MKIKLIMGLENDIKDILYFNSLSDLLEFINELTVERLIDNNSTELKYKIVVE